MFAAIVTAAMHNLATEAWGKKIRDIKYVMNIKGEHNCGSVMAQFYNCGESQG